MRYFIVLFLFVSPVFAQTVSRQITLTFQTSSIAPIKAFLAAKFMEETDTDEDGVVSDSEALTWFEMKAQEVVEVFKGRAIQEAALVDATLLPQAYRDALIAKEAADASLKAEEEALQ